MQSYVPGKTSSAYVLTVVRYILMQHQTGEATIENTWAHVFRLAFSQFVRVHESSVLAIKESSTSNIFSNIIYLTQF